jgi:hypothetical protein
MIEELDRTTLTHGKLLFPFQFVRRYLAVRMPRHVQKTGKRNHVASQGAHAAYLYPGSQSARKTLLL